MVLVLLLMLLCFTNPFLQGVLVSTLLQRYIMHAETLYSNVFACSNVGYFSFQSPNLCITLCAQQFRVHNIPRSLFPQVEMRHWLRHYFSLIAKLLLGDALKEGTPISVNPLLLWAWAGLLINAINSIPAGELDGGRISFAIWGRKVCTLQSS